MKWGGRAGGGSYGARRTPGVGLAWAAVSLLASLAACGPARPIPSGPSVLLVTIDTLRADRVGAYGGARELTPWLDSLASEGVRFERAYSHAPFTAPSHASLLTSLLTPSHGVLAWAEQLDPTIETLADRFDRAGYRTACFYSNPGLRTSGIPARFDHERQFFFETAEVTAEAFFGWLDGERGPFCAWVHLWDVHRPYAWRDWRPEWLRERIGEREPGFLAYGEELFGDPPSLAVGRDEAHYNLNPEKRADPQVIGGRKRLLDQADLDYIADRYDAGVRFADRGLGLLLDGLRSRGLYDDTLLVVTSDHGESLLERPSCYFTHDPFLFEETLRVPLVLRLPGGAHAGRVVEALARGVDVLPTIYEVARVAPAGGEQGHSLLGRIRGDDDTGYLLHAQTQTKSAKERNAKAAEGEWLEHRTVLFDGRYKLLHDHGAQRFELYDLEADPSEREDRAADPALTAELARLREAYEALEAGLPRAGRSGGEVDPAMTEALRQMGYTGD